MPTLGFQKLQFNKMVEGEKDAPKNQSKQQPPSLTAYFLLSDKPGLGKMFNQV